MTLQSIGELLLRVYASALADIIRQSQLLRLSSQHLRLM